MDILLYTISRGGIMSEPSEPMILVGFGKHDLKDLWDKKDTPEGEQMLMEAIPVKHWPPRYRRISICTQEEVNTFQEYLRWVLNTMTPKEEDSEDADSNSA
jgi:hypothetical protein